MNEGVFDGARMRNGGKDHHFIDMAIDAEPDRHESRHVEDDGIARNALRKMIHTLRDIFKRHRCIHTPLTFITTAINSVQPEYNKLPKVNDDHNTSNIYNAKTVYDIYYRLFVIFFICLSFHA